MESSRRPSYDRRLINEKKDQPSLNDNNSFLSAPSHHSQPHQHHSPHSSRHSSAQNENAAAVSSNLASTSPFAHPHYNNSAHEPHSHTASNRVSTTSKHPTNEASDQHTNKLSFFTHHSSPTHSAPAHPTSTRHAPHTESFALVPPVIIEDKVVDPPTEASNTPPTAKATLPSHSELVPELTPALNTGGGKDPKRSSVVSLKRNHSTSRSAISLTPSTSSHKAAKLAAFQKKKGREKWRKRFLFFSFFLSVSVTILWVCVFFSNGWFSRDFQSTQFFDYLDKSDVKRHRRAAGILQNHLLSNSRSLPLKQHRLFDKENILEKVFKTKRQIEKKRLTLSGQYGGIWRMCSRYNETEELHCHLLDQYPSEERVKERENINDVITFRRSCAAMGIIAIVILLLTNSFVYYSLVQHRYVYKRLSGSLLIGGAACILVCLEIFQALLAREQEQTYPQTRATFGPCYVLAWICVGLLLTSSAILFYTSKKQKYNSIDDRPVIIGRV